MLLFLSVADSSQKHICKAPPIIIIIRPTVVALLGPLFAFFEMDNDAPITEDAHLLHSSVLGRRGRRRARILAARDAN